MKTIDAIQAFPMLGLLNSKRYNYYLTMQKKIFNSSLENEKKIHFLLHFFL